MVGGGWPGLSEKGTQAGSEKWKRKGCDIGENAHGFVGDGTKANREFVYSSKFKVERKRKRDLSYWRLNAGEHWIIKKDKP